MKHTIFGNTQGLNARTIGQIEKLYQNKNYPDVILPQHAAQRLCQLSFEIQRQIGLLINRNGRVEAVIVGDPQQIMIPETPDYRATPGRLKGLRCVHTHLKDTPLTRDDLTDLALLRLDLMTVVSVDAKGYPEHVYSAHVRPGADREAPWEILPKGRIQALENDCQAFILELEDELFREGRLYTSADAREQAILVSVSGNDRESVESGLNELVELAESNSIHVIDTVIQMRRKPDPKFLMGKGKLSDLTIYAMQKSATMIVFDQELTPAQVRSITDAMDLKVIDRTQLILDIFSQRARTREGKLQVELAQLKYMLPRLATKNTAMSRLTGGIGGRGPGETKLEINRRRARDQINTLTKALKDVERHREQQRARRTRKGIPVFSIIGYTNAGKSTLLNTLTQSEVRAKDQLFATLDPSSRRLRFPQDIEVIITDTVGFIRDLPKELMVAFKATLEELSSADILLHVIDISNPRCMQQVASVNAILEELDLEGIPVIPVLNKMDQVDAETCTFFRNQLGGVPICAKDRKSLSPLFERMTGEIPIPDPFAGTDTDEAAEEDE